MDRSSLRDDDVPLDELERSFREGGGLNKPAATAVRINPRGKQKQVNTAITAHQETLSDNSSPSIIGSIVEKPSTRGKNASTLQDEAPLAQQAAEAFPVAQHRKQSRFCLARQKAANSSPGTSGTSVSTQVQAQAASLQTAATRTTTAQAQSQESHSRASSSANASYEDVRATSEGKGGTSASSGIQEHSTAVDEAAVVKEIKEQNDEFISRLKPVEIKHLLDDIHTSMKPEVIAKLTARKEKRPNAPTQPPSTTPPAQASLQSSTFHASAAAAAPLAPPQPQGQGGVGALQAVHNQARAARQSAVTAQKPPRRKLPEGSATDSSSTYPQQRPGAHMQLPPLVRTRFNTAGVPVGWLTDEEVARVATAADVAMRDPLRRDEGSAPQGYTVEEAVLLLATSHAHLQRVGVRVLTCLALRARPRLQELWAPVHAVHASGSPMWALTEGGHQAHSTRFTAPCPDACSSSGHRGARTHTIIQVPWAQMWAHLHHESAVAGPLLQLLQRTATGDGTVRSEALECIAALVGAPWEVLLLLEFSWTHPLLGWPMVATGALRRAGPAALWTLAAEPVLPDENPEAPLDPSQVLENDTVLGLLLLGLLPMLRAELRAARSTPQHAALRVITAVILSGSEAALSVASCTPLVRTLRDILMKLPEDSSSISSDTSVPLEYSEGEVEVMLHALMVVRLIVASGAAAAAELVATGVLDMPRAALMSAQWASAAHHPLAQHAQYTNNTQNMQNKPSTKTFGVKGGDNMRTLTKIAELSECMRIWRACALAEVHYVNLDDAMPCVLRMLAWSQCIITSENPKVSTGADSAVMHAQALAAVVVQDIALLLTTMMQRHFPCEAPLRPEVLQNEPPSEGGSVEPTEGVSTSAKTKTNNLITPGCVQQLLPLLIDAVEALEASGTSPGIHAVSEISSSDWGVAQQWLQAHHTADAQCADYKNIPDDSGRHAASTDHEHVPLLQPPQHMHAALCMPLPLLRRSAALACMQAVDAAEAPRHPSGHALVPLRSAVLERCLKLSFFEECSRTEASKATSGQAGPTAPLLYRCMHEAVTAASVMTAASLSTRAMHLTQRAVHAVPQHAAQQVHETLESSCSRIADLALVCESSLMHDCVANAFGAWAAARIHSMHLVAASLVRTIQAIAAINGRGLPLNLFSSPQRNASYGVVSQVEEYRSTNPGRGASDVGLSEGGVSRGAHEASPCMRKVMHALLMVPCMTTSPDLVLDAFQILFSPVLLTPCVHASHACIRDLNSGASRDASKPGLEGGSSKSEKEAIITTDTASHVLHAAYAAAWTGTAHAPPPLPAGAPVDTASAKEASSEESSGIIREPATLQLPEVWLEESAGCGKRLPAPPDWCMLAIATHEADACDDTADESKQRGSKTPGAGERSAAILGTVLTWLLGLLLSGVSNCGEGEASGRLRKDGERVTGLVEYAWHPQTVLFHALRLAYMSSDAAFGQADAHNSIMHAILASPAVSAAMHAILHTLAETPLPPFPPQPPSLSQRTTASDIFQRLGRPAQGPPATPTPHIATREKEKSAIDSVDTDTENAESAKASLVSSTPVSRSGVGVSSQIGSSGITRLDAAGGIAGQFAAASLGDPCFAQAVLLLCRSDVGCGDEVWRVLNKAHALHCMPSMHSVVGGSALYASGAVHALQQLLDEILEEGSENSNVPEGSENVVGWKTGVGAALVDGQWSTRMLLRSVAASGVGDVASGGGSARGGTGIAKGGMENPGMGGLLWGCWLLETICSACMSTEGTVATKDESADVSTNATTEAQSAGDSTAQRANETRNSSDSLNTAVNAGNIDSRKNEQDLSKVGGESGVVAGWVLRGVRDKLAEEGGEQAAVTLLRCAVRHAAHALECDEGVVLADLMRLTPAHAWDLWGDSPEATSNC